MPWRGRAYGPDRHDFSGLLRTIWTRDKSEDKETPLDREIYGYHLCGTHQHASRRFAISELYAHSEIKDAVETKSRCHSYSRTDLRALSPSCSLSGAYAVELQSNTHGDEAQRLNLARAGIQTFDTRFSLQACLHQTKSCQSHFHRQGEA